MAPIDEAGAIWSLEFSSNTSIWSLIKPVDPQAPFPEPRSYHAMAFDGRESIYLHAGCPEKGRLSDLWAFHLGRKSWKQLALAPEPARGGTSIAYETQSAKLYRMNGFDGQKEQGGTVDVYDVAGDSWSTVPFTADGLHGPEARSVSTLACTKVQGKKQLVTMFGERDPSSLGHAGAGKMLSDVWIWDLQDKVWSKVAIDNESGSPAARGWFAADVVKDEPDTGSIIVHGGLAEDNTRLGDVWLLQF
ncbi:MAG: hypothetical protein M1822_007322 [Bathelium mastoideum]|nr:MAG: hypothetical protein M1822_007322 [Bathelium mastoideum]